MCLGRYDMSDDQRQDEQDEQHEQPDESQDKRQDEQHDSQGGSPDVSQDEQEIAQVREERLDPDNRPDGAEVDNTGRTFDPEKGLFTDQDEYDEADPKFVDDELPDSRKDTEDESDGDTEPEE